MVTKKWKTKTLENSKTVMGKATKKPGLVGHLFYVGRLTVIIPLFLKHRVSPGKYKMALASIFWAVVLTPLRILQRLIFYPKVKKISFEQTPPIFIIGHFRSGTTHLHYLLSRDPRWATATNFHAVFTNIFLLINKRIKKWMNTYFPERRIQDNVHFSIDEPQEEEQALFGLTAHCGLMGYAFPRNQNYFKRYDLFEEISEYQKKKWQKNYLRVLQLIAYAQKNTYLILKNPHNTGRVKELLELFPQAKFIFIVRNPYEMYQSVRHWYDTLLSEFTMQEYVEPEREERIFRVYRKMIQKYLRDREAIPDNNLVEIRYEDLIEEPESTLKHIYNQLQLPDYNKAAPHFKEYMKRVRSYKKNEYNHLPLATIERIEREWNFAFEYWGYDRLGVKGK